ATKGDAGRCPESLAVVGQSARERPDVPDYPVIIVGLQGDLGALYRSTGQRAACLASDAKALPIRENLAREHPEVPAYREQLDSVRLGLGATNAARGGYEAATAAAAALLGHGRETGIPL